MKIPLMRKILAGYAMLLVIIGSMCVILLHEHNRMGEIDAETLQLRKVRSDINTVHRYITELATYGETVIAWGNADCKKYHSLRLHVDGLLQDMKIHCAGYVKSAQIDTLRGLLADKEKHLLHIVDAMQRQEKSDSILANQLPEVAKRATRIHIVKQKRSGIAGLFGGTKDVQVTPSAKELHELNDSLKNMQEERVRQMEAYSDSIRLQNKTLNGKLRSIIKSLDNQAQASFQLREQKVDNAHELSMKLLTMTISAAILLLFLSYLMIHRELKRNANEKEEREGLIKELQKANEMKKGLIWSRRNIIQTITHELRTPLTSICGNAELVEHDEEKHSRIRHAETIRQSAIRMEALIDGLLNYFRLDSGKESVCKKPFRLDGIAWTLESEFTQQAGNKRLKLTVHNHADEVVDGDKSLILRIGSNLLSNAIKFTKDGSVTINSSYADGLFTLEIRDTGTGIGKDKFRDIFEPFERLGNAATQDGFGLGLAIVKSLVELMDGSISVESEPGKGSRFTVTLPLEKAQEEETEKEMAAGHTPVAGYSVVAIDNDGVTLGMMRDMFARNGVRCDTCLSVAELTDKMRSKDYDLLITDLRMPDMDGYDVLELLRSSELGNSQTIPVVAATAAGNITEEELKSAGFAAMLAKPFSIEELLSVSEKCIGPKKSKQPDISPLLAFGNKWRTLERLVEETEKQMAEIHSAIDAGDMEALDSWIHHLRSSWMLMKAEQPLQELYDLIHSAGCPKEELAQAASAVLRQGEAIILLAKKEMEDLWEE